MSTVKLQDDQRAGDAAVQKPSDLVPLSPPEMIAALVALTLWFLLFAGGSLISTETYRRMLMESISWVEKLKPLTVCVLFWTTSNIGMLACLAAFLGGVGYRCRFTEPPEFGNRGRQLLAVNPRLLMTSYIAAVMRGFGTYTLSLAGLLLVATDTLTAPSQTSYLRLAPLVSIASFYSGFNPRTFAGLLNRVKSLMQTKIPGEETAPPAASVAAPQPVIEKPPARTRTTRSRSK